MALFGEGNPDDVSDAYAGAYAMSGRPTPGVCQLKTKVLRGVRFVLKLVRGHLLATCQVGPMRCLCEKLPSRLSKSGYGGYARLRACSNTGSDMSTLFCPLTTVQKQTLRSCVCVCFSGRPKMASVPFGSTRQMRYLQKDNLER